MGVGPREERAVPLDVSRLLDYELTTSSSLMCEDWTGDGGRAASGDWGEEADDTALGNY